MTSGDRSPNISFLYSDGSTGSLADFRGKPLLLIFLRHLA